VIDVQSPYFAGSQGAIARDGRSALVSFEIPDPGDDSDVKPADLVDAPLETVRGLDEARPGFRIEEFGDASADKQVNESFEDDFRKAEVTSLPITLIILLLAFGALVAAVVPLLLAATAVAAAIGLLGPLSRIWPVDQTVTSVVLLVGLAVGVDYSMFYLRREREERARGKDTDASIGDAAATSGRAVLFSGATVAIAMAGMFMAGAATFTSFAVGTITVVVIAVVGSLTVLPAILSKLGDRVNKGRIPFFTRPEERVARESLSGRRFSTGCCAGRCSRRWSPPWSCSSLRLRCCTSSWRCPASRPCRRTCRWFKPKTGFRRPSRATRSRPTSWSSGATPRTCRSR
jgi:RND superfamily putative drug exporter